MSQLVANLDPEVERHFTRPRGKLALWTGVLGGPLAWSVQLLFCYVLVRFMCGREWLSVVNHVATLVLLAAALACVLLALREWNRVRREDPQAPETAVAARSRFLAGLGILVSGIFSLVIVAQWMPLFFLSPCDF